MKICVLASGSRGNVTLIRSATTNILIDCGVSYSRLTKLLNGFLLTPSDVNAIVITHSHSDHIQGLPTFLSYNPTVKVFVRSNCVQDVYERTFWNSEVFDDNFCIGEIQVESYCCHHDVACCGYRFFDGLSSCAYVTDTGFVDEQLVNFLSHIDTIVVESNHDLNMLREGRYPPQLKRRIESPHGHLSNDQNAELLAVVLPTGVKHVILAHLSEQNNTATLALSAAQKVVEKLNLGGQVTVTVAEQRNISEEY